MIEFIVLLAIDTITIRAYDFEHAARLAIAEEKISGKKLISIKLKSAEDE